MNNMCGCQQNTCPKLQPIVCPERVVCTHCTYYYNQPVIVPIRTHVINHYVPQYTYQYQRTTTAEDICHGNTNAR